MASERNEVMAELHQLVVVAVSFAPNGVSQPVVASTLGRSQLTVAPGVVQVNRTGVGAFDISFDVPYAVFIGAVPGLQLAALADQDVQFGAFTPKAGAVPPKIAVRVKTAAAASEIAAAAANRITVLLLFSYAEIL